jgi:predicted DNA-binding transcriptional regulator YafY
VSRTLSPLGVVLKAGRWYLAAETSSGRITCYVVANILEAEKLTTPVIRPPDFDLAAFWHDWTARYEQSVYTMTATVRMRAGALDLMHYVSPYEMYRQARAAATEPDESGWLTTIVPIESIRHGHTELLRLGAGVEVLEPAELRDMMRESVRGLAETYLTPLPRKEGS